MSPRLLARPLSTLGSERVEFLLASFELLDLVLELFAALGQFCFALAIAGFHVLLSRRLLACPLRTLGSERIQLLLAGFELSHLVLELFAALGQFCFALAIAGF